ncbi:MAG: hypothetical protein COS71_02675 [Candidatus Moranbacteria bacterium CG06_land_8_20_14_3_00_40_12]|nr:MAG: hypothetical protein COX31_04020 [Candidatus Moranbacteria bacterium CG23_combo_of_CG06-09_8_20_14_all_40_16]PIU80602.1 MAG: hypothetical protein COS71_02675 [Candidatus Moranbacteria bacterium CG06_land_8_20_14_3_00_40_12]
MILSTHALVGAALGKNLENPWLIVILCPIVHFALDSFRHGEYIDHREKLKNLGRNVALDIFAGGSIILSVLFFQDWELITIRNVFLGILFCLLPDFLTLIHYRFTSSKILKKIYRFHQRVHPYPHPSKQTQWNLRNAVNDILFSLAAVLFLIF